MPALPTESRCVSHTGDSGEGSLRQALLHAELYKGPDSIYFNIPVTDPGYDEERGVWIIQPESLLPHLGDVSTVLDGETQKMFIGEDTNPLGPAIMIDGS